MPSATLSFKCLIFHCSAIYQSVILHENKAMNIQSIRRVRLAQLIRERFGGSQAKFVETTGENQGEVSALLRDKSFGEKKARKIEAKCGLDRGWLDLHVEDASPSGMPESSHDLMLPAGRWIAITGIAHGKPDGELIIEPCPPGEDDWSVYSLCADTGAYALRVKGDGMRPRLKHGECIVVETGRTPQPGDDVLVTRCEGGWLIRELLWMRDDEIYLASVNHHCPPATLLSSEIGCVHRIAAIVPRGSTVLRKA